MEKLVRCICWLPRIPPYSTPGLDFDSKLNSGVDLMLNPRRQAQYNGQLGTSELPDSPERNPFIACDTVVGAPSRWGLSAGDVTIMR
jgi:hypothetical protein